MLSLKFVRVSKRTAAIAATVALTFAGLVAGVAAPASATTTNVRQAGAGVILPDAGSASRVVEKDGFIYTLVSGTNIYKIYRSQSSSITTTPVTVVDTDPNVANGQTNMCATEPALGSTVSNLNNPGAITISGDYLYVINCANTDNPQLGQPTAC